MPNNNGLIKKVFKNIKIIIVSYFFIFSFLKIVNASPLTVDIEGGEYPVYDTKKLFIDPFSIDTYETTNIEYNSFVIKTGRRKPLFYKLKKFNSPLQPVVGVNYYDAESFCRWKKKRLPKSAEWQVAGYWNKKALKFQVYPWGDKFDNRRLNSIEGNLFKTAIVGSYPLGKGPNGLYDIAGNVWEWMTDWFDLKKRKVIRGGSWGNKDNISYSTYESSEATYPDYRLSTLGFRCVKSLY